MVKGAVANPASRVIQAFELFIPQSKMLSYTSYMAQRLFEMRRVLKPEGSIYLHCDPTASHYLKLVMDAVFGEKKFLNEIVWHYQTGGASKKHYARKHDILLFFSKAEDYQFYPENIPTARTEKALKRALNPKGARIQSDDATKLPMDVWIDIQALNPMSNERLGYPTQKPLALLERIIKASSNRDDIVLDPFCGCGTTIEAARKLNRQAIGIDVLPFALRLINQHRILKNGMEAMPMYGIPVDMATATQPAKSDPYKFQDWAISLINGLASNPTKTGDDGVDGFGMLLNEPDNMDRKGIVVQVTGASGSQRAKFDRLQTTIRHHNTAMGILITLDAQPASKNWKQDLDPVQMGETTFRPIQCFLVEEYFRNSEKVEGLLTLPPLTNPWTGKAMQKTLFD